MTYEESLSNINNFINDFVNRKIERNEFSFDEAGLGTVIASSDPLSVLLRGHLYIEHVIIQAIQQALPYPERMDLDRLNFASKVSLVRSLAPLPDWLVRTCQELIKVRNKIAHRLEYRIDSAVIEQIIAELPEHQLGWIETSDRRYADLSPETPVDHISNLRLLSPL